MSGGAALFVIILLAIIFGEDLPRPKGPNSHPPAK